MRGTLGKYPLEPSAVWRGQGCPTSSVANWGGSLRHFRPLSARLADMFLWAMRWVVRVLAVVGAVFLLVYAGDWMVWRVVRAGATGSVMVSREVVASLKGNREEYFYDGTQEERCSRSMLPEGGMRACWWVERHRVVFDR